MTIVDRRYGVAEGTAVKAPCRVATTANVTLAGLQTIDGVALAADDRVLVKSQSTASENGIYIASSGNWTRSPDFDGTYDVVDGTLVNVTDGTANAETVFMVSVTDDPVVIGTSSITISSYFSQGLAASTLAAAIAASASATASATAAAASASAAAASATLEFDTRALAVAATIPGAENFIRIAGYAAVGDGGGALYKKVGAEPSHTGKLQSTDGAWWEIAESVIYPEMFGAVSTTGAAQSGAVQSANVTAFQNALDYAKQIHLRDFQGRFDLNGRLAFKGDYYGIIGANQGLVQLNYTGTTSGFIYNDADTTTTRLWCRLENLRITAPSLASSGDSVINWKSFQFGRIKNVWATAASSTGIIVLDMQAQWTVTECTYNVVEGCYFGLCAICVRLQDGANSNRFKDNRMQPSVSGGSGIAIIGSASGRVSDIVILGNGFEYPGNISNGVNVFSGAEGIFIRGNRFEALSSGIIVTSTNISDVSVGGDPENYFSSCTTKINYSGSKGGQSRCVATASIAGGTGSAVDKPFGITAARSGAGDYLFTFDVARPNANYKVALTIVGAGTAYINSQLAASFQVLCRTLGGAPAAFDPSIVQIAVFDNV
jgi:hypothetical protein